MNKTEFGDLFEYLKGKGAGGASVLTIRREIGVSASRLFRYVKQFPELFIRNGGAVCIKRYSVNSALSEACYLLDMMNQLIVMSTRRMVRGGFGS